MGVERTRIGLREIRALQPNTELWDSSVAGFGARRQRSAAVAYVLLYRTAEGRQRRYTIGRHGAPWVPDTARNEAKRLLGLVAVGEDPASGKAERRKAMTVAELCADYWKDVEAGRVLVRGGKPKKHSTIASDKGRIEGHIIPLLGKLRVGAVTRSDVEAAMHKIASGETAKRQKTKLRGLSLVRGGKGVATRTVGLIGGIFAYAVEKGIRDDNPAHGIRKYAEVKRERRLSDAEYGLLGLALKNAEHHAVWPPAVKAVRFMALTGWRSGEVLGLKRAEIDLKGRVARLTDTKTGPSFRPLSNAACALLAGMKHQGELMFPATRGEGPMAGFRSFWEKIARLGPLPLDISPHTLRHSFASLAADIGYSETTIGALIGHKGTSITSRYVHAADAVLLVAADAIADRMFDLMRSKS